MRYAKRKTILFSIMIVTCFMLIFSASVKTISAVEPPGTASPLEYLLDLDVAVSEGNNYGDVLSVDGKPIAADYVSANGESKFCAVDGYSQVIGSPSGGLIYSCRNILLANGSRANLLSHKGNTVVTTLHSEGMQTAEKQLAEYGDNVNAYITVVLRDGAVLVSAANNSCSPEAFFDPDSYNDLYVDYNASRSLKGSTFKPLTLRMLLLHNDELGVEYSLYNENFIDYNSVTVRGNKIVNWDSSMPGNYLNDEGNGLYSRQLSLSKALQLSANTYVLRHAEKFGLEETYKQMKSLYNLDKTLHTEINELTVGEVAPERLAYFPWGQDADLSSIEMCQLFNYMVGGRYYIPFYVARVIRPDGRVIYTADPAELEDKRLDIDPANDILDSALADTFCSYLTAEQRERFYTLAESHRVLAKSGTADLADESVNRVVMLSVLSEDRSEVICTACMCIDHTFDYNIQNSDMIEKLLTVLDSMSIV